MNELLSLTKEEYAIILEGLDAFKSRDFSGELIGSLFKSMFIDKKSMTPEQLKEFELKEEKDKIEKELKEEEKKKLNHKADIIKAKLLLMQDSIKN